MVKRKSLGNNFTRSRAVSNIIQISVNEELTTEQVVMDGNYTDVDPNITSQLFPWRRRNGKRTIELVDMTKHGYPVDYAFNDALNVLDELGLDRPVYEDGLLTGKQHRKKQGKRSIMFPHEPVLIVGVRLPGVVSLLSDAGRRVLDLDWADLEWYSDTLVAGVRRL